MRICNSCPNRITIKIPAGASRYTYPRVPGVTNLTTLSGRDRTIGAFMTVATRLTKSFSIDREIIRELEKTKGASSTSERVNNLLRVGLEVERQRSLHSEAAAFFRSEGSDRGVRKAFRQAGIKSMTR